MILTTVSGTPMARIGLGTWPMDDDEAGVVVARGLDMGYRLVDTAFAYGNEIGVGRGLRGSSVPREDIFVTTKFNRESHSVEGVMKAYDDAARKLDVDYIDLMLIHWPNPDQDRYVEAWEGLVALQDTGRVRYIGVSSFLEEHLTRIIEATDVVPVLNQMQVNPRYLQTEARAYNDSLGIHTQSWSPLGQGNDLLADPLFGELAEKHDSTPGQVVLAWHLAHGMSTIPKSSNPVRMRQNLEADQLVLAAEDIARIDAMDGTEQEIKHPNSFWH